MTVTLSDKDRCIALTAFCPGRSLSAEEDVEAKAFECLGKRAGAGAEEEGEFLVI